VAIVAEVLLILNDFLFDIAAVAKLPVVSLLFWTDGKEGVQFLELPGNPWAGLFFISHIEVSNSVAVGAQDDALLDFFLDLVQTKSPTDCISNIKHLVNTFAA
jgi:hypothetical protein